MKLPINQLVRKNGGGVNFLQKKIAHVKKML